MSARQTVNPLTCARGKDYRETNKTVAIKKRALVALHDSIAIYIIFIADISNDEARIFFTGGQRFYNYELFLTSESLST